MLTVGLYGIKDISNDYPHFVHDHSITFMRNGKILSTITLERYTNVKHDQRLGTFITSILEKWILEDEEVRFVSVNSFLGSSFISDDGTFRIEPTKEVTIEDIIVPAHVSWYRNGKMKHYAGWVMCHEFAHIASTLPFGVKFDEQQLLVHIDGGASKSACSFWQIRNNKPILLHAAWDDLKDQVNNFNIGLLGRTILGLEEKDHLSMPGKLMGFAAYGELNLKLLQHLRDRGYYLDKVWTKENMIQDLSCNANQVDSVHDLKSPISQTIAACIQYDFQDRILKMIRDFKKTTNASRLIYTGGAALNIPTNTLLEKEFGFGNVFIPPCTDDSGLSIGAASWIEFIHSQEIASHSPFLNKFNTCTALPSMDIIPVVAEKIACGKIVALCTGCAEVGPRALGHRSIIARPDNIELRTYISEKIKNREWYRPIAPAILPQIAMHALKEPAHQSMIAPFMLGNYSLKKEWKEKFSGVVHVDGTVRAQVVRHSEENSFLYRLLEILKSKYDIAGLINTSFNMRGKPIVHSKEQALAILKNMPGIDMVIADGSLHYA